jgi:DNA-binding MarR family transcriptional regulator
LHQVATSLQTELFQSYQEVIKFKTLNNSILREIGTLSRTIHSKCDLKFKAYHLQKGQFIFLTRVCENPGINHIQLSNLLKVDKTTATKAVQKLIISGYLRKEKSDSDSRAYQLYPTPKALEIYELVIEEENANIDLCFNGFTSDEITQAYQFIKRMSDNVEAVRYDIKKNKT